MKWNIQSMNDYCVTNAIGYSVKKINHIDKGYQKQLYALVKCPNDRHDAYWTCWNNFIRGNRCRHCYNDNNNMEKWDKYKANDYLLNNGYTMLNIEDFKNVDKCVYCRDIDGFIYNISISNLKRALKSNMGFSMIKNNKYALDNIKLYCKLYRPDYDIISNQYLGVKALHKFIYFGDEIGEDVDKTFLCTVDNFINGGVRHPNISISKGELKVKNILENNNIKYIQQHTFQGCRNKQILPFDFYLPNHNICIEYQGMQHYKPVDFFGGEKIFLGQQKRDKIKTDYCNSNGIKLIRIPYTDFNNIEEILNKYIA